MENIKEKINGLVNNTGDLELLDLIYQILLSESR